MKQYSHNRHIFRATLFVLAILVAGCGCQQGSDSGGGPGAAANAAQDFERGPHNGRLLRDGDFALEVTIFETGVPPEFRLYPYRNDQPIAPGTLDITVELGRLGNHVDTFEFYSQGEFLRGNGVVIEPHSFDVTVTARQSGKQSRWRYESYEGRTRIESAVAQAMGIEVAQAAGRRIRETIELRGTIQPHPNALSEVRGRFPGLIQALQKTIGDTVRRGDVLARVQSNESLQTYVVTAPRDGTVIAREASGGGASGEHALYAIPDISRLVSAVKGYGRELGRRETGQT